MFGFFTVVFFIWSILSFNTDLSKHFKNLLVVYENGNNLEDSELKPAIFTMLYFISLIILMISEFVYLLNAIKIDIYRYPTYTMLAIVLIVVVKSLFENKNTKKVTSVMSEDFKKEYNCNKFKQQIANYKKPSKVVFRFIMRVLNIVYYSYMMWIVFIR